MLTKTKKWLSVFVLALVAVLLVGCKKEPVVQLVNPTAIEISLDVYEGDQGVVIGGDVMLLSINTTPANAIKTVTWSSLDASKATVNAKGEVTGLKGGKVKIKAVSTVDETLVDEVEIFVYEDLNKAKVLVNAMNEVKSKMPKFVVEDFQFPTVTNTLVKVEYFDAGGNKHANNVYTFDYAFDAVEMVNVKLTYEGEELEFASAFNVVEDAEHNEFLSIDAASELLDAFMLDIKENKVTKNFELPSQYLIGEGEDAMTITVTWVSSNSNVLKVTSSVVEEATVTNGKYNRPNDDTPFVLEAYLTGEYVSKVARHNVVANGYSVAEKVAYITENTLPKVTEVEGANVFLSGRDSKFGAIITWSSSNAEVLSVAGKMNPFLLAAAEVTLTATISYPGTLNETHAFEEAVELVINVKPAANDAQRIVLDLGNRIEADADFPFYFPWGDKERANNVLPLPAIVGGESAYKDLVVTWTASEAGLFSPTWELQKQYLRYHAVNLTFSVTSGAETATGEIMVNVGLAELANTVYMGGRWVATNMGPTAPTDGLHTISPYDPNGAGVLTTTFGSGKFNGMTFYLDETNEQGVVTRYQYYASNMYTYVINEGVSGGVNVDENGVMTLFDATHVKSVDGNNEHANFQYMLIKNNTTKDIKVPIAYLNYKGSTVKKDVNGTTLIRQTSLSIDGWRFAFATDGEGKVTFGYGATSIEPAMTAAAVADEDGNISLPEYVTIPAGGYGFSPFTNQNSAAVMGRFCVVDTQITFAKVNVRPNN